MSIARVGVRAALTVVVMLAIAAVAAPAAMAEATITACMPYATSTGKLATGKPIVAGTETGTCKNPSSITYHPLNLPSGAGFETLNKLLAHMTFIESGVGGKPTIRFSGVNVQVVNGEGKTATKNGEGNLVIGYDENKEGKHEQTGSHDLILGEEQTFTSYAGLVAGEASSVTAPFASVSGGQKNTASAGFASVSGGIENTASQIEAWVGGGLNNTASGERASVSGGVANKASGYEASVSGGAGNNATNNGTWVGGGIVNTAEGEDSSVFGGKNLKANFTYEACGGEPTKLNC
jgi:hypothetical protein